MMLLASALAVAVPTPAPANDIVVTAAKLRKIRISADADPDGRITACRVTVSSGDAGLDDEACEATRACTEAGIHSGEAVGDCVDHRLIAFANARRTTENGSDASGQ
jgi:TonB family protein